ncbi:MAG: PHP domain-containing protein [Acidobacteria bacterium]|nr:PHP domain-containing protein [Acidobacteriota bacterium]
MRRSRVRVLLAVLLLGGGSVGTLVAQEPAFVRQFRIFFGNLHAHTSYSDGSGTPAEAYAHARTRAGLDFLAITEHNHRSAEQGAKARADGLLIGRDPALYTRLVQAARDAARPDFVALWGQEFSTISAGNHVNVFGVEEVIDDQEVPNGDFRALYERWLRDHPGFRLLQFNHPWDGDDPARAYGRDDYHGSYSRLRAAAGRFVSLIEVINGPGLSSATGVRASVRGEGDYREYLRRGFRLAPTADQDNHYRNWGLLTEARTGVLAPELTRDSIVAALRDRRAYATTDRNLRLLFGVNDAVMGSEITATSRDLRVFWSIEDPDEGNAPYEIRIVRGNFRATTRPVEESLLDRQTGDGARTATLTTPFDNTFVDLRIYQRPDDGAARDVAITSPVWVRIP